MITRFYVGQKVRFADSLLGSHFPYTELTVFGFSPHNPSLVWTLEINHLIHESNLEPVIRTGPGLVDGHISNHVKRHPTNYGEWVHA